jgi:two-component system chemotaxis sensor kinase CheA
VTAFSNDRNSELRELFFESAAELLQALNEDGLALERNPEDPEITRRVRRTVHTLKGDSAAAGFPRLSEFAHQLEDALATEIAADARTRLAELVLRAADCFGEMLAIYQRGGTPEVPQALANEIRDLVAGRTGGSKPASAPSTPYKLEGRFAWSEYDQLLIQEALHSGQTVYNIAVAIDSACPAPIALQMVRNALHEGGNVLAIFPEQATGTLDVVEAAVSSAHDASWFWNRCRIPAVTTAVVAEPLKAEASKTAAPDDVLQVEDHHPAAPIAALAKAMIDLPAPGPASSGKASPVAPPAPSQAPQTEAAKIAAESILRVDAERIDEALNLVGELIISKSMLTQSINEFDKRFPKDPLRAKFADALAFQARALSDLQKSVMKIRMVPVEQLFRRFPRIVRDVAKACGKEAEVVMAGETTDLDKSILDMLAEPLSHIVRNAIDHGLEAPAEREKLGKPRCGSLRLDAYHQGNHIVIECSDDGRGIDRQKLTEKALERGIVTLDEVTRLSENEALALVFHPGLSTAAQVTAISGRGVGLDVVKTVMERLKGSVHIQSEVGRGTTFLLKVPLTLAIIKALMFRSGERVYAVPLASVVEITRAKPAEVHRVDRHEVIQLRGEVLTLVRADRLNRQNDTLPQKFFVVVVSHGDRKFGLVVEQLVGEEELVIKALDDHLVTTEFVSGASILGDGTVVLILNIQTMIAKLSHADAKALRGTALGASA